MCSAYIASLGLILDILGALLIWKYVAEINFANKEDYLNGEATLQVSDPTEDEIKAFKRNVTLSRVGISLLLVGFVLQLISQWVVQY